MSRIQNSTDFGINQALNQTKKAAVILPLFDQAITKTTGATLSFNEDPMAGTKNVDVLYTDVWVSMGEPKEVWKKRAEESNKYQVTMKLLKNASKKAIFMHCLPAFHGMDTEIGLEIANEFGTIYSAVKNGELEVTAEVIESVQSVVSHTLII